MKVLIADDEKLECEALIKMLHLHFPEVTVLESAANGLELVKKVREHSPDIAIVDINMPDLDGLSALEVLQMEQESMEILIHTAYSDFDFIHKALKMGAADYLVKPVFEEDFVKVFKSVIKKAASKKTRPDNAFTSRKIRENMQTVAGDNIMMGLLLNQPDSKSWQYLPDSSITTGWVLSLSISAAADSDPLYSLVVLRMKELCQLFSIVSHQVLYCLFLPHSNSETLLRDKMPELLHPIAFQHDFVYRAGVSSVKKQQTQFPSLIFETDTARKNADDNQCCFYAAAPVKVREDHFAALSEPVSKMLKQKNIEKAYEYLCQKTDIPGFDKGLTFADQYYGEKMITQTACFLDMERRRTGTKWTIQNGMSSVVRNYTQKELSVVQDRVPRDQWLFHVKTDLQQLSDDMELPLRERNPYVEQAVHQIRTRYMEDLALEQLAQDIGITQFYLSRLLKQERNQTFLEVLTTVRIQQALERMENPTQSIPGISQSVGYTTKYFYQIFRNVMGISQRDFRDALFYPTQEEPYQGN